MKRISLAFFLFLLCAIGARAQTTTVSGTITDSNGQSFNFGTYKIEFFSNGLPTPFFWNGTPFDISTHFAGALDATGSFAGVVVPSSNFITPVGTGWRFTVCSAATTSQCYAQIVTVTGTTLNVTGLIVPVPIVVNANQFSQPAAYTDGEIAGPILGFTYYPINTNCLRVYTGGAPPVWQNICGGGGGGGLTSFSAGDLPPLFTTSVSNPTTTPALSFILSNAGGGTVFGNPTGATGSPLYTISPVLGIPGASLGTLGFAGNSSGTVTISGQAAAGTWHLSLPVNAGTNGYFLQTNGAGVTSWQPAPGGGTGCVIPGTNTGVVSEHPIGTCYDSIDFTWDDGVSKQNLQAGVSNTVGTQNTVIFGPSNTLGGQSNHYALGDGNDSHLAGHLEGFMVGSSNTIQNMNNTDAAVMGVANTIGGSAASSGGGDAYVVGVSNTLRNANGTFVAGTGNTVGTNTGTANQTQQCVVVGANNFVATVGGDVISQSCGIFGAASDIGQVTTGTQTSSYIGGYTNHIEGSAEGFIWGLDNSITTSVGDVVIVGASNTATNTVSGTLGSNDNFIGGFLNTVSNSGNFAALGGNLTIGSCTACAAVGFNIHNTTSNSVDVGISSTPEIVVTSGKVKLNATLVLDPHTLQIVATTFSGLPACSGGTEGSQGAVTDSTTNTWGATVTGGGSNHVTAYCNGTNWSVMGSTAAVIAGGAAALGTSAISSGACATVVTASATGVLSTDVVTWTPNASIKAVTGYAPSVSGGLSIVAYPTANNVNFDVCNWSTGSITPGAVTLNWSVRR